MILHVISSCNLSLLRAYTRRALTLCISLYLSSSPQISNTHRLRVLLNHETLCTFHLYHRPHPSRQSQPYVGRQHLPFRESTNTQGHQLCPRRATVIIRGSRAVRTQRWISLYGSMIPEPAPCFLTPNTMVYPGASTLIHSRPHHPFRI
jgi:hypothetical protein